MAAARDWRALFEEAHSVAPSGTVERIWREVYGDDYPTGVDPYSYVGAGELARFADEVRVGPGERIADLGCGKGGPGLWVAIATGARLIGIDIAESAVEAARRRADSMGVGDLTEFKRGSFDDTGIAEGGVSAAMSVDALLFAPDKAAALTEVRRVLPTGGRLVFTSCDYHGQPPGRPPQVDDHRPLLYEAGFEVLAYEETADWRRRLTATTDGLLANVEEVAAESGESVESMRAELVEMQATFETMSRRVLVVARAA